MCALRRQFTIDAWAGLILGDLHQFDPGTATWTSYDGDWAVGAAPARMGHGLAEAAGLLFMFGGLFTDGEIPTLSNELHSVDVAARAWTVWNVTGVVPSARFAFGFVGLENNLFVFGGIDASGNTADPCAWLALCRVTDLGPCLRFSGGEVHDLYEFRAVIKEWRLLQTAGAQPGSRSALGMTAAAGRLIIFGGSGGAGL